MNQEQVEVQEEQTTSRRLVTIRTIASLDPIPGADVIECATVDGWQVVVKKGEFAVGDLAVYFEIDSFLPASNPAFAFLMDKSTEYNNVVGVRLRTIRLRKQVSQGLLLPLATLGIHPAVVEVGDDLTEIFGVQKWERPVNANLAGTARGNFPQFIPKTDQERIQNIYGRVMQHYADKGFEVSIKLDGSSMTVYRKDEDVGVCSRNLDLVETEGNSYWDAARKQKLIDALQAIGLNIAVQGELIGEGIQGNPEGIAGRRMYIFDIYNIDSAQYMLPDERANVVDHLRQMGADVTQVPMIGGIFQPSDFDTIGDMLKFAEGKCSIGGKNEREGLVWKDLNSDFSFKTISNKFLLKGGD